MAGKPTTQSKRDFQPMAVFSATDDGGRRDEITKAINALNDRVIALSPSKEFSEQFLALIRKAQEASNAGKWDEAHDVIWEATFLINRAIESMNYAHLRFWLTVSPILSFVVLLCFEWLTNYLWKHNCISSVLMSMYFPYLWTGAIGGTTIVYWGLIKHTIDLDFDDQYVIWYLLKPILGAITAVVSVLIVKAGLFTLQGTSDLKTGGEFTLYVIAFLTGFSERFFIQLIDRVLTALFGGGTTKTPAKSTPPPSQSPQPGQTQTLNIQQQKEKKSMRTAINSQSDFDTKVKGSKGGMLLMFHATNSSQNDLDKYADQAKDKCGENYLVYTIDIDKVGLSSADVNKYQDNKFVICCTVLFDDVVVYKKVNPDPAELWNKIQC